MNKLKEHWFMFRWEIQDFIHRFKSPRRTHIRVEWRTPMYYEGKRSGSTVKTLARFALPLRWDEIEYKRFTLGRFSIDPIHGYRKDI